MVRSVSEADWKVFRGLSEIALERFCKRILDEVTRVSADDSASHHERYLEIYASIGKRNREMADAFDGLRRSTMTMQLALMNRYGLVEAEELARFSEKTRRLIQGFG